MKLFLLSILSVCAVAAYAGDVANPGCGWALSGYECAGPAVADVGAAMARG